MVAVLFLFLPLGSTLVVTSAPTGSMARVLTSQRNRLVSLTPTFARIVASSRRTHQRNCTAFVAHLMMKTSESQEQAHVDGERDRSDVYNMLCFNIMSSVVTTLFQLSMLLRPLRIKHIPCTVTSQRSFTSQAWAPNTYLVTRPPTQITCQRPLGPKPQLIDQRSRDIWVVKVMCKPNSRFVNQCPLFSDCSTSICVPSYSSTYR